jgi:alpha-galactosidase
MLARRFSSFGSCAIGGAQRVCTPRRFRYAVFGMEQPIYSASTVVAAQIALPLDSDGFPSEKDWQRASPIRFATDWQGKNSDELRETLVRTLWSPGFLFLKYRCRYRTITVFADCDPSGRRDELWDRDVAEVFLQPDPSQPRRYFEFEIAPNGMWIDLDIAAEAKSDAKSGMKSRTQKNHDEKIWSAELALPLRSLTKHFDPSAAWRANFFRVEGISEPRFYSAWQPTRTAQPNFHVPEVFGTLRFESSR